MSWIKLHRKFLDWEWYQDSNTCRVFLHLLLTANFEDRKWRGKIIRRGQRVVGSMELAGEVGFSRQSVRTVLERLKSTNEITSESTNEYTILTIVKYEEYQGNDFEPTNESTNELTNEQPTNNQRTTTTKELKNLRKERKNANFKKNEDFEKFWGDYGKIGSRSDALKAFEKIKDTEPTVITEGLKKYKAYCVANINWYRPRHASTWLNARGWEDDYPEKPNNPEAPKPLTEEEIKIQALGRAAWKRKYDRNLDPHEERMLAKYEKFNGLVWWQSLDGYQKGRPPDLPAQ